MGSIIYTIVIGFLAGVIAKFLLPGDRYEPKGFIYTTLLGIVGAFVATFVGQQYLGWGPNTGANFFGSVVGAFIVLAIYVFIASRTRHTI